MCRRLLVNVKTLDESEFGMYVSCPPRAPLKAKICSESTPHVSPPGMNVGGGHRFPSFCTTFDLLTLRTCEVQSEAVAQFYGAQARNYGCLMDVSTTALHSWKREPNESYLCSCEAVSCSPRSNRQSRCEPHSGALSRFSVFGRWHVHVLLCSFSLRVRTQWT